MTGMLFIINVPQKEFENGLIKNKRVQKKLLEMTKDEQKSKSNNLNHKSKGEVTLSVPEVQGIDEANGRCSKRSSSSWIGFDDIRGDKMKSKNKLVITRPVRGVDIVGAFDCDTPLETILSDVISRLDVRNATWCPTQNNKFWQARTNLAQVLQSVRADAALTFDWCFLLLVAALVAAIGLVENSTVVLVASMLISPLMGPITAGTLGTAVRDRSLQMIGVTHELLGLLMCLAIGFVFGLVICAVDGQLNIVSDWPTGEMMCRCEYRSLWVGMLIAIPSGAGVALAVLGDYTASLVGVAISASLLPPAVNAGLLWAMSVYSLVYPNDLTWRVEDPMELAVLGSRSLCLTLINIICIYVAGVAVYKVKNVSPLEQRDITWWSANKSRLQASKRLNTTAWEIYRRWPSSQLEKTDAKVHETITFRRLHVLQRMKAQSLEDCFRNIQTDESYQPLDSEASESQNSDSIKSNETERLNFQSSVFIT